MFVSLLSRDTTYKLLKSICRHLEVSSNGSEDVCSFVFIVTVFLLLNAR